MLNERDEKHYEHEESEYHFSDDDVSYEVESDTSKPVAPESEKKNPLAGLTQSKRMMISLVVFIGLVFVVYKMVSPGGSQVPATDISPVAMQPASPPPVATAQQAAPEMAPPALPHTAPAQPETPSPSPAATAQQVSPAATAQQVAQPATTAMAPLTPATAAAPPTTTTTTTTVVTAPASAQPAAAAPPVAQAPVAAQPVAQVAQPAAPVPPAPLTTPSQPVAAPIPPGVPGVPVASAPQAQQPLPVATTVVTTPTVTPANTDAAIAAMAATNEKLMTQLQAEYSQKVTDFSNQTKAMQEQMQSLSSKVAGLETQLGQLVQTLTRQSGMGGTTSLNVVPAQQPPPPPIVEQQPRIRYNVQAIIPGRAWLKSDNGETLTVAEGDSIKELGRVSKIDPYDGVVEVNTGSKTVSISYGSGG